MVRPKIDVGMVLGTVLLASLATVGPARTEKQPSQGVSNAGATLERFKKLAGDWTLANPKDKASGGKIAVHYQVTAGGSAVMEVLFPGDKMEMVTMYHRDGDQLMLTHYCCCGNQPRMRTGRSTDKDVVVFEFAGGSNLNPKKDPHMHSYRVRFVDADHLNGEWQYYVNGKADSKHTFDLVRKK